MTTINDIADFVNIVREQPQWADMVRGVLLGQELLNLPSRFAEFVELTSRNFELVNKRFDLLETRLDGLEVRLDSIEVRLDSMETRVDGMQNHLNRLDGRFSNFEGSDYERRVRFGVLHRCEDRFDLRNAYLALSQSDPRAPQLHSVVARAISGGSISREQSTDLHEADIIISDENNCHVLAEVSLTASETDIIRAKRRAGILSGAAEGTVIPVVVTAYLNDAQRYQAEAEEVVVFVIPYP